MSRSRRSPSVPALLVQLAMACVLSAGGTASAQEAAAVAITSADLDRLMGRWYEIARLPVERERDCVSDVVAEYERRSETAFRINLTCRTADDDEAARSGVARVRDRSGRARFDVRFAPLAFAWLPFVWDDWWVLEVSPRYDYLMAGGPDHGTLWIYAREPALDEATYRMLVEHAAAQGFDTSHLIRPRHARSPAIR